MMIVRIFIKMVIGVRPVTRNFHGGVAYLKNRDQIITVGIIGHASAEDTKLLGGGGGGPRVCSPGNILKFLILELL